MADKIESTSFEQGMEHESSVDRHHASVQPGRRLAASGLGPHRIHIGHAGS